VINRRAADLLWPGRNAVGERIRLDTDSAIVHTVVGVARNISNWDISGVPLPTAYVPLDTRAQARRVLIVRTTDDAAAVMAPVREIVASFDRTGRGAGPHLLEEVSRDAFSRQRTMALLFSLFSVLSLLLTIAGVYGVLSCFVSERRREIGIRAALGASRRALVWLVGRQAIAPAAAGIGVGVLLAIAAGRVLRSMLFEVSATDPLSYNATAILILAISALAAWLPAHRAASANPVAALRD
jgi:putative ABC transport system permease protein